MAELSAHHGTDETGQALSSKLQPAWQKMSESSKVLLAIRGMSPTDAASIAAYARTVGYFDDVVRETLAIEAAETAAAAKAEKRLLLLGAGGASGALLALLLIGLQIYRVVFARLGGEPALACELAGRLADYDRSRPFGPWLRGIAQNLVLAHGRRVNAAPVTMESGLLAEIDARFDELANAPGDTFTERTQRIWDCLRRLPEEMRRTLELVCLRSVPVPAAAEELGSNRETVWKRVQRGRRLLADCLGLAIPEEQL